MSRVTGVALAATVLVSGVLTGFAAAQTTFAAHEDGKQFATDLAEKARTAASTAPNAVRIPNFTANPTNTDLATTPDAIAARAAAAAQTNEGYRAVRSSIARRPAVQPADVRATVARGKAIARDAGSYVTGVGVGGTSGSCKLLPPSATGGIPYDATCNVGVAVEQQTRTCITSLEVTVTQTVAYRYWCSDDGAPGMPACSTFEAAQCAATGSHPAPCGGVGTPSVAGGKALATAPALCANPGTVEELLCRRQVPGARLRGTETVPVIGEQWREDTCAAAADTSCALTGERCSDATPQTRVINGMTVTRDCWAKERSYQCSGTRRAEDCDELEHNPSCRFAREDCLTDDDPCPTTERVYHCMAPNGPAPTPQYLCDGDIYCLGGECETIDRQPNAEFKDAAVALHAAADARNGFDPASLRLFNGTRETCHSAVFGILNCCAGKAFPLIPAGQLLVALGCDREEILLHERDNQGLCTYVGSYCSSKVLGICTGKRKACCCFESKLSRILQEQGRAQIGKPWGKPKTESCEGFTADEFARLDLSRMDFSEVYAEFSDAAKLPEELSTSQDLQQRIRAYYQQAQPQ